MSKLYIVVSFGYRDAVIPYSDERMAAIVDLAEHLVNVESWYANPLVTSKSKVDLGIRVVHTELLLPTVPENEEKPEMAETENA